MFLYAVIKYIVYCAWCFVGARLITRNSATFGRTVAYGTLRWLLGLVLGVGVFIITGAISEEEVALRYFVIYTPLRVLEWGVIAALMISHAKKHGEAFSQRWVIIWVIGAIGVSFATDLVSPEGLAGKFCIGRCFC